MGNYLFKFTYLNNDIIITPQIFVYDSEFEIENNYPYININSFHLSNVSILFKGKYHHNQIKKVYLIHDNGGNYNGYKYDITSESYFDNEKNTLNFIEKTLIDTQKQYHIEMIGDINTYIYYLHYIGIPNSNQFTSNNIEIDLTKNNNLLAINNRYSLNYMI